MSAAGTGARYGYMARNIVRGAEGLAPVAR